MKKTVSLISLVLSMIFILSACGNPAYTLMDFINEQEGLTYNYDGYEFVYLFDKGSGEDAWDKETHTLRYKKGTIEGDAMMARIAQIEKDINVKIVLDPSMSYEQFQIAASTGAVKADMINYGYMNAMSMFADAGYLEPIDRFPEFIDLSDEDKYGGANVLEPAMIDSVPYAVSPLYWPGNQAVACFVLVYNKDLVLSNGITDFHEFYENKTWTWDTFENEFLAKAKAETSSGYLPALETDTRKYFDMLMYSNNTQFVKKNAAGENIVTLYPQEFQTAYEKGLEWSKEYKETIILKDELSDNKAFISGNTITALCGAGDVVTGDIAYSENQLNYGIMPFPAGPDAPYGTWAQFMERSNGYGIPVVSQAPDISAHVISLLFEPFEEMGGRAGLYDYYNNFVFSDEIDTEIYFDLGKHVRYDYTFVNQNDVGREVAFNFGNSIMNGIGISEAMEKYQNSMVDLVHNSIVPNFDYMYENYYYQFDN